MATPLPSAIPVPVSVNPGGFIGIVTGLLGYMGVKRFKGRNSRTPEKRPAPPRD